MIHIKNVQPGQIFHPFKSSATYICLEILGTTKKEEVKKEFPYSVVRGMMWETVPLKVDILSYKELFDKIF